MTDLADRLKAAIEEPTDYDAEPAALKLRTRRASDIEPRDVDWLWKPWLPAGMLGLCAGRGGSGKSTVALSIAAQCSIGGTLPDGQPAPLLNTLIFASEDSPAHTTIPRLIAMGANLDRIHIVEGVAREGDDPDHVQVRAHAVLIEQEVDRLEVGLVIIDPIASYLGNANTDKESDVRAGLMPLVAMAQRTQCAVVMIRHVSKAGDSMHAGSRILGSTAWRDVPRVAWMLADAPDEYQPEPHEDGTRDIVRVLGVDKSNLGVMPAARMCVQSMDGPLQWNREPSPITLDECFYPKAEGGKKENAEEWLADQLKGGSVPSAEIQKRAKAPNSGVSFATVRRAKEALGVEAVKIQSTWYWRLKDGKRFTGKEGAHSRGDAHVERLEHLERLADTDTGKALTMSPLGAFPPNQGISSIADQDEASQKERQGDQGAHMLIGGNLIALPENRDEERVQQWLAALLANGSKSAREILEQAKADGVDPRAIGAARSNLGVVYTSAADAAPVDRLWMLPTAVPSYREI